MVMLTTLAIPARALMIVATANLTVLKVFSVLCPAVP
jgi:hypothetical protein